LEIINPENLADSDYHRDCGYFSGSVFTISRAAWEANNVMAIVGILVVGIHLFRSGQGMTRQLLALKCGGAGWAVAAFIENITNYPVEL
jgi:hypothetical protein